ncbi:MAG: DUF2730 family protein [Martelella sp.]|uniref:DUF2730 family protein n=1 Tax=Martelella sp. TaxID=1969699 RepID=UPI003241D2D6
MTPEPVLAWLTAANSIIALGSFFYAWLTSRAKGNSEKLDKLEDKVVDHDRRIQDVESEMRHLPDKDTVMELKVAVTELKGAVATISKSSEATERATRRVEEFLLSRKD